MALFSRRRETDETGEAGEADAPTRVASGQTGPVSRPVAAVAGPPTTGPTPIVELHETLLHTATPRVIGTVGLAATLITGVLATVSSFTDDGLFHMRPQINEAFLISMGVMAFGCLWWSTFATANGRRVTRGRTLGPILPMAVYVGIAVSYLALNANVHGEARVWAWIAWAIGVFAAHAFVMTAFKSAAQTIGNPTTHFTQMALIPVMMAGAVAIGMGVTVLRGIPFLAVPLLLAWMVPELYRAMYGWDRACTQRMRVMLRDFSYDMPSGQVAAVATSGQVPVTPEPLPVAPSEAPSRVAGTHHPQRPVWNPVEEARKKAEAQAAAMMNGGVVDEQAAASVAAGRAPRAQRPGRTRRHHTLIPKLMVTFGAAGGPLMTVLLGLLLADEHIQINEDGVQYTDTGRQALIGMVAFIVTMGAVSWLWWATASLANARQRSAKAPWPGIVVAGYWAAVGGVAMVLIGLRIDATIVVVLGVAVAIIALFYAAFGGLAAVRTAAGVFGAPKEPWSLLLKMPFIQMGFNFVAQIVLRLADSPVAQLAVGALALVMQIWQSVTLIRGVWSFDSASRRPPLPKVDEAHVPLFMRHAAGVR